MEPKASLLLFVFLCFGVQSIPQISLAQISLSNHNLAQTTFNPTTVPSLGISQITTNPTQSSSSSGIPLLGNEQSTTSRPRIPIFNINLPRVSIPFVISGWVFSACLVKTTLNAFPRLVAAVPESCLLILAGILMGFVLYLTETSMLSPLSSSIFFFCMLPPIILDAGYFMPNRPFFDHLGTILLFAVVGTFFNTITIGISLWACGLTGIYGFEISLIEVLIFSSLISAVDPVAVLAVFEEIHVDQVLYIIVFGESLLNDAVSVVLYNMFDSYLTLGPENIETVDVLAGFAAFLVVAIGGSAIGVFWGFLTGFITRFTHRVLLVEPIFIFVMSYLAYLCAEALQLSGILSIMFCGITMKNYVAENVSPKSLTTVKCGLKMFSHSSEAVIFMFLGVNTVNDQHEWNTAFILLTILFCSLYRALGVIILTELANYFRLHQLNRVEKFVMSYGGLRGAIAFALVLLVDPERIPRQPLFVTATISVVFFTVFFQGITIKPLVEFLKVKREEKRVKTMNERIHEKLIDYTMAGMEDILGKLSSNKFRDKFKHFDNSYIRPYLIREKGVTHGHEPKILETYSKLTMKDAVNFARRNPSSWLVAGADPSNRDDAGENIGINPVLPTNESGLFMEVVDPVGYGSVERHYNPSEKDLTDAKIHHLLSDSVWKPHRKHHDRSSHHHHHSHHHSRHYEEVDASCDFYARKIRFEESFRHRSKHGRNFRDSENHEMARHRTRFSGEASTMSKNGESFGSKPSDDFEKGIISFTAVPLMVLECTSDAIELPLPWKCDSLPLSSSVVAPEEDESQQESLEKFFTVDSIDETLPARR